MEQVSRFMQVFSSHSMSNTSKHTWVIDNFARLWEFFRHLPPRQNAQAITYQVAVSPLIDAGKQQWRWTLEFESGVSTPLFRLVLYWHYSDPAGAAGAPAAGGEEGRPSKVGKPGSGRILAPFPTSHEDSVLVRGHVEALCTTSGDAKNDDALPAKPLPGTTGGFPFTRFCAPNQLNHHPDEDLFMTQNKWGIRCATWDLKTISFATWNSITQLQWICTLEVLEPSIGADCTERSPKVSWDPHPAFVTGPANSPFLQQLQKRSVDTTDLTLLCGSNKTPVHAHSLVLKVASPVWWTKLLTAASKNKTPKQQPTTTSSLSMSTELLLLSSATSPAASSATQPQQQESKSSASSSSTTLSSSRWTIPWPEYSSSTVETVLDYLHTGKSVQFEQQLDFAGWVELARMSHVLELPALTQLASNALSTRVNRSNVQSLLQVALELQLHSLMGTCVRWIQTCHNETLWDLFTYRPEYLTQLLPSLETKPAASLAPVPPPPAQPQIQ